MCDQRFSIHVGPTLSRKKKTPLNENFTQFFCARCYPLQDFLENMFDGIEKFEKWLLAHPNRIQKGPIFLKIGTFWPLITIIKNPVQPQPLFAFLWLHMCTTLVLKCPLPGWYQDYRWVFSNTVLGVEESNMAVVSMITSKTCLICCYMNPSFMSQCIAWSILDNKTNE